MRLQSARRIYVTNAILSRVQFAAEETNRVGFESSHMARRRLASMAMSNQRVQEALVTALPESPDEAATEVAAALAGHDSARALSVELELLAQDIAATPGAGGALLASFAEQSRVLQLVVQAVQRAPGAPLPADVMLAVHAAVHGAGHSANQELRRIG